MKGGIVIPQLPEWLNIPYIGPRETVYRHGKPRFYQLVITKSLKQRVLEWMHNTPRTEREYRILSGEDPLVEQVDNARMVGNDPALETVQTVRGRNRSLGYINKTQEPPFLDSTRCA